VARRTSEMTAGTVVGERENELSLALADDAAFRHWYERTMPRVFSYLVNRGGDQALAEELTQQTFIAAIDGRQLRRPRRFRDLAVRHRATQARRPFPPARARRTARSPGGRAADRPGLVGRPVGRRRGPGDGGRRTRLTAGVADGVGANPPPRWSPSGGFVASLQGPVTGDRAPDTLDLHVTSADGGEDRVQAERTFEFDWGAP